MYWKECSTLQSRPGQPFVNTLKCSGNATKHPMGAAGTVHVKWNHSSRSQVREGPESRIKSSQRWDNENEKSKTKVACVSFMIQLGDATHAIHSEEPRCDAHSRAAAAAALRGWWWVFGGNMFRLLDKRSRPYLNFYQERHDFFRSISPARVRLQ
jgi:hypothetical protein